MKPRIFLSYSQRDRAVAEAVARELEKLGVTAFNPDREQKPGGDWRTTIMDGIRRSDQVAVIWNPNVSPSDWMNYEVGSASALGKDIVVMKPADLSASDLPGELAGWQTLDLDPASPGKIARLLASNLAPAA